LINESLQKINHDSFEQLKADLPQILKDIHGIYESICQYSILNYGMHEIDDFKVLNVDPQLEEKEEIARANCAASDQFEDSLLMDFTIIGIDDSEKSMLDDRDDFKLHPIAQSVPDFIKLSTKNQLNQYLSILDRWYKFREEYKVENDVELDLCGSKIFVEIVSIFSNFEFWRKRSGLKNVGEIPQIFFHSGILGCSLDVLLSPELFGFGKKDYDSQKYQVSFIQSRFDHVMEYFYILNLRFLIAFKEAYEYHYNKHQKYFVIRRFFDSSRYAEWSFRDAIDFVHSKSMHNVEVSDIVNFLASFRNDPSLFSEEKLFRFSNGFIEFLRIQLWSELI